MTRIARTNEDGRWRRLAARLRGDPRGGKVSQREGVGARYGTVVSVGHPRLELTRGSRGESHGKVKGNEVQGGVA